MDDIIKKEKVNLKTLKSLYSEIKELNSESNELTDILKDQLFKDFHINLEKNEEIKNQINMKLEKISKNI